MELGVYKGETLRLMEHDGLLYGVDSFEGMPQESERDIHHGYNQYPKGRFATPMFSTQKATLVKGWVPEILSSLPDVQWAFVHVDMDQYDSTYAALEWLFPRMMSGGIICCDDYVPNRHYLAGGAINAHSQHRPLTGAIAEKAWWVC